MKKIVDERQEAELHKIEHYGFWIMFWALFAAIMYQITFVENGVSMVWGEVIVMLLGAVVTIVGCMKKGLWNYGSDPTIKNYLFYSIVFTALYGVLFAVEKYRNYDYFKENMKMLLISTGIYAGFTFVLTFALLFVCGTFVRKRRKKLEDEFKDDDM